jgi:hypothetical protein
VPTGNGYRVSLSIERQKKREMSARTFIFLRVSKQAYEVKVSSTVRSTVEIPHDPKDDPFCLCSEQGKADFIVTFNPKDFPEDCLEAKGDASRSPPSVRGTGANTKKVETSDSASH